MAPSVRQLTNGLIEHVEEAPHYVAHFELQPERVARTAVNFLWLLPQLHS